MNSKKFLDQYTLREVVTMTKIFAPDIIARVIVEGGAISIRDIENDEAPFKYSSGNFGPGYISIKGTVSDQKLIKFLVRQLALKSKNNLSFDGIAGLVTGGLHPSAYFRDYLQKMQNREIVWVYIRDTRKPTGTKEHITGIFDLTSSGVSESTPKGMRFCVFEELTNFSITLVNGANILRKSGYECDSSFSILDYDSPESRVGRKKAKLKHTSLITLPELLNILEERNLFEPRLVNSYRQFQTNPDEWQRKYIKKSF